MSDVVPLDASQTEALGLSEGWVAIKPKFSGDFSFGYEGKTRHIKWYVVENRVIIDPPEDLEKLTHAEKIRLFNPILAEYRLLSRHPDKFYSSALGITQDGQIYIADNKQRQKDFHKDCAEVCLINSIPDLETNKLTELYVMVGFHDRRNPDSPKSGTEKAFCPCGKCTDALANALTSNATLVTIPDGKKVPQVNFDAHTFKEVETGQTWSTKFEKVNKDAVLKLSNPIAELGREAKRELVAKKTWVDRVRPFVGFIQSFNFDSWLKRLPEKVRGYVKILLDPNNPDNRIHLLDADPSEVSINSYMVNEIAHAY